MSNSERPQKIRVTFSRAYRLKYVGCGVLDRCFTHPMLPWVVGEIKRKGMKDADTILLEVTSGSLRAISCSRTGSISGHEDLLFEHKFPSICKVAQHAHDKSCFAYLTRDIQEAPFKCHVFQATDEATVLELFATMRDMGKNATGTFTGSNPSLNGTTFGLPLVARMSGTVDSFSCNSQQFEVLYIGKIKVSHKRAPPSFIDEAVEKFKQHETERLRQQQTTHQPQSNPPSAQPSPTTHAPSAGPLSIPVVGLTDKKGRHRHGSGSSVSSLPYALEEVVSVKENELQRENGETRELMRSSALSRRVKKIRSHGDLPSNLDGQIMDEEEDESQSDDFSHGSNGSIELNTQMNGVCSSGLPSPVIPHSILVHPTNSEGVINHPLAPNNPMPGMDQPGIHSLVTHTQSMDVTARKNLLQDLQHCAVQPAPAGLIPQKPVSSHNESSSLTVPSPGMLGVNDSFVTHSQSLDIPGRTAILQDLHQAAAHPVIDRLGVVNQRVRSVSGDMPRATKQTSLPFYRTRVSSGGQMDLKRKETGTEGSTGHQFNRAMLFLIGKLDLCLVGTDMKQVLLRKTFSDISHCCKGVQRSDHFGFICREVSLTQVDAYVGYVFRCQTKNVVDEIMQGLKQAFNSAHQAYQKQQQQQNTKGGQGQSLCEACPMHWFHRLCIDLEGLPPDKIQLMILRRMKTLSDVEREDVMIKYHGAESDKVQEQNEIYMMLLRGLCEHKQLRHTHQHHQASGYQSSPSQNNHFLFGIGKTESFQGDKKGSSTFDNLKEKAKKSLSNSFDSILKKRSKEDLRDKMPTAESDVTGECNEGDSTDGSECSPPHRPSHGGSNRTAASKQLSLSTLQPSLDPNRIREGSWDPQQMGRGGTERLSPSREDSLPPRPRSSTFSGEMQKIKGKGSGGNANTSGPGLFGDGKSPIMSIFMKVGNQNKPVLPSSDAKMTTSANGKGKNSYSRSLPSTPGSKGPWRQTIFQKVQTPSTEALRNNRLGPNSSNVCGQETRSESRTTFLPKRSTGELRRLWKKAIMEQILLIRMENENKKLQDNQDAVSHKRMRLDYQEVTPCLKEAMITWERFLFETKLPYNPADQSPNGSTPTTPTQQREEDKMLQNITDVTVIDKNILTQTVREGVPRHRRGDIWKFLAAQQRARWEKGEWSQWEPGNVNECNTPDLAEQDVQYGDLLKQLTPHQHAILIDLGRTFPSHPFFAQPLGAGQLSLFNLLKAYSLLDPLVGYCQGLSFVAGVLLLHMGEEEAFHLMRHVLFRIGFRKQYKPDMVALQIQMYQLSRLIHDTHREVYEHFEEHDIAPTLYAAPWFLTLFASQFPLGFVSRLFDLIFLQGVEAVFKVALVLLGQHKESLLSCTGFESVMDFLKNSLPNMGIIQMERLFNAVFTLDISRQLQAYRVEYQVLQEELLIYGIPAPVHRAPSPSHALREAADKEQHQQQLQQLKQQLQQQTENTRKAEILSKEFKQKNYELQDQVEKAQGRSFALDSQMASYQSTVKRLETRIRDLEDERDAHLHSVNVLRRRLEGYETPGGGRRSLSGPQRSMEGIPIAQIEQDDDDDDDEEGDENRAPALGLIKEDASAREELNKAMRKLSSQMSQQQSSPQRQPEMMRRTGITRQPDLIILPGVVTQPGTIGQPDIRYSEVCSEPDVLQPEVVWQPEATRQPEVIRRVEMTEDTLKL